MTGDMNHPTATPGPAPGTPATGGDDGFAKPFNPIGAFLLGWIGVLLMGQQAKALWSLVPVTLGMCCCCVPGMVIALLYGVDAYKCAEAMQNGEQVGIHEYKFELAYKVAKTLHKEAVFNG